MSMKINKLEIENVKRIKTWQWHIPDHKAGYRQPAEAVKGLYDKSWLLGR